MCVSAFRVCVRMCVLHESVSVYMHVCVSVYLFFSPRVEMLSGEKNSEVLEKLPVVIIPPLAPSFPAVEITRGEQTLTPPKCDSLA